MSKNNGDNGKYDWELIEKEYRVGQLSLRQIADKHGLKSHGAITNRAKRYGWTRDLSDEVRTRIKSELNRRVKGDDVSESDASVSTSPTHDPKAEDEKTIQEAVQRGLELIEIHQKTANKQRSILQTLNSLLDSRLSIVKEITSKEDLLKRLKEKNGKGLDVLLIEDMKAISIIIRNSAQALNQLTEIERKAYNIDDQERQVKKMVIELD